MTTSPKYTAQFLCIHVCNHCGDEIEYFCTLNGSLCKSVSPPPKTGDYYSDFYQHKEVLLVLGP